MWDGDFNGSQTNWNGDTNSNWFEYRTINEEKQFYVNELADLSQGPTDVEHDHQHVTQVLERLSDDQLPFKHLPGGILGIQARKILTMMALLSEQCRRAERVELMI